jgi:hypothetical protein
MITISDFPNANWVATDDEKNYPDVPMMYEKDELDGYVITAYKISWRDRFRILFMGGLSIHELTYHESISKRQLVVCRLNKQIEKVVFKV